MDKFRLTVAIAVAKVLMWLIRLLGGQGSALPGKVARIIYPRVLEELGKNITEEIMIVTGTNGKTTTTNMIAEILKEHNYSIIHNYSGANMITGITTTFIEKTNLTGTKKFDYALLETDEANVPLLLKELTPKVVLITNFFRDQLDRYGEMEYIINLIKDAVRGTNIELVLNADDPLVSHFHRDTGLHCWYFGFDKTQYDTTNNLETKEGRLCVICGHQLNFERYHYAQLGKFYCPQCENQNPRPNFKARDLVMDPQISFYVNDIFIQSPYQGFYNAYNILAAVSIAKLVGLRDGEIQEAIKKYQPRAGRMESFIINGKRVVLTLIKNTTGLNQTLSTISLDNRSKNLLFVINDNVADGTDVSWLWDSNLEVITEEDFKVNKIFCAGLRSGDIALRVKYTGFTINNINLVSDLNEGIKRVIEEDSETSYVLSTYTALMDCRKILVKMQEQSKSLLNEAGTSGMGN